MHPTLLYLSTLNIVTTLSTPQFLPITKPTIKMQFITIASVLFGAALAAPAIPANSGTHPASSSNVGTNSAPAQVTISKFAFVRDMPTPGKFQVLGVDLKVGNVKTRCVDASGYQNLYEQEFLRTADSNTLFGKGALRNGIPPHGIPQTSMRGVICVDKHFTFEISSTLLSPRKVIKISYTDPQTRTKKHAEVVLPTKGQTQPHDMGAGKVKFPERTLFPIPSISMLT